MSVQQRFDALAQDRVTGTNLLEITRSFFEALTLDRFDENRPESGLQTHIFYCSVRSFTVRSICANCSEKGSRRYQSLTVELISLYSHALAKAQQRFAVRSEIPRTCPASCRFNPPKKRRVTNCAARESSTSSFSSASFTISRVSSFASDAMSIASRLTWLGRPPRF